MSAIATHALAKQKPSIFQWLGNHWLASFLVVYGLWALLPIALDGVTHAISDFAGIGQGFHDTNQWIAMFTQHALSSSFLAGDALGSFNSWARIITGLLAGLGIVWLVFPHVEASFGKDWKESNTDQGNPGR